MRTKSILKLLLLVGLAASLSQCSGDDEDSDKVKMSTIPGTPVVINAPFSYYRPPLTTDGEPILEEVEAPWFLFKYSIFNGSSSPVVIQTIKYTVKTTGIDGTAVTFEGSLDPVEIDDFILGEISVGGTLSPSYGWFVNGIPESKTLVYQIEAEMIGWFGTRASPTKSFNQKFSFTASD